MAEDLLHLYSSSYIITSVTLKVLTAISFEAQPLRQKLVHLARKGSHAVTQDCLYAEKGREGMKHDTHRGRRDTSVKGNFIVTHTHFLM